MLREWDEVEVLVGEMLNCEDIDLARRRAVERKVIESVLVSWTDKMSRVPRYYVLPNRRY